MQPQISSSVRDKPAEAVVYQWFKHPATILLSSLQISKTTVKPGEDVEVAVKLENTGDLSGNYTIVFKLDGVEKESFPITLDGGATTTKTIKISSEVVGIHQVSVGDKSNTLEVVQSGVPSYPFEAVVIGVLLCAAWLLLYNARCHVPKFNR